MGKDVCVLLLSINLWLAITNGAVIDIRKRSVEGFAAANEVQNAEPKSGGQVSDDVRQGPAHFQHILPIWWHYFRPLVEVTLQDDLFRRQLQKQFEHELEQPEATSDDIVSLNDDISSGTSESQTEHDSRTSVEGIKESSETGRQDDPTELSETHTLHETSNIESNAEDITEQTNPAGEIIENGESWNRALNGFTNTESEGSESQGQAKVDDSHVEQDKFGIAESTEHSGQEIFHTGWNDDRISPEFERQRFITGNIINGFTSSVSWFQQPLRDESGVEATHPEANNDANDATWNNNMHSMGFGSLFSEGFADDRNVQVPANTMLFPNTDDTTNTRIDDGVSDIPEQQHHRVDDGFASETWFPSTGDSNSDSDFSPSFTTSMPFFTTHSHHNQDSDSSS